MDGRGLWEVNTNIFEKNGLAAASKCTTLALVSPGTILLCLTWSIITFSSTKHFLYLDGDTDRYQFLITDVTRGCSGMLNTLTSNFKTYFFQWKSKEAKSSESESVLNFIGNLALIGWKPTQMRSGWKGIIRRVFEGYEWYTDRRLWYAWATLLRFWKVSLWSVIHCRELIT
jgi:hypothetical protein